MLTMKISVVLIISPAIIPFPIRYRLCKNGSCHLRSRSRVLLSGSGSLLGGGLLSGGRSSVNIVLLAGAVNGDLDSDLTSFDLLAVHLLDGLLLELLGTEGDETETTTLAGLVTGLELLDHEARNRAESDLGRNGLVGSKELLEL